MKKRRRYKMAGSLVLFMVLTAAAGLGLVWTVRRISGEKENMAITEQVLYGDRAAAKGWSFAVSTECCNNRLLWDTAYTIGSGQGAQTEFTFVPGQAEYEVPETEELWLYPSTDFGMSSTGKIELRDEDLYGFAKLFQAVADRTKKGERHTETVRVADYYAFYPLELEMQFPAYKGTQLWGNMSEASRLMTDFFRIPVAPEHKVEVTIEKNTLGEVTSLSSWSVEGMKEITVYGVFAKEGCYLLYEGKGLCLLPFREKEDGTEICYPEISVIYKLPAERKALALKWDAEQRNLLLITEKEGQLILSVLEKDTMTVLQELTVEGSAEDSTGGSAVQSFSVQEEGLLIQTEDGRFCFLEQKHDADQTGIIYEKKVTGDFYEASETERFARNFVWHWNGSTLAVAASREALRNSVVLAVYSAEGREFTGLYAHSGDIDRNTLKEEWSAIRPRQGAFLKLWYQE